MLVIRKTATPLVRRVGVGAVGMAVLCLRAVGLVLPSAVLGPLLWPIALLRAAWELSWGRPTFGDFRKLSGRLPPPTGDLTARRLLLGRAQLNLAKLLFVWPERLAAGREVPCRIAGTDRLEGLGRSGPAVLVTLHFGPMGILLNWLRARGYPVVMVAMSRKQVPWYRRYLIRKRDTPKGLGSLPSLIEVGRVWEMRDHLAAGGILMIAIDGGSGRHSASPIARGLALSMSTGALQLAALTGATVIPCLIRSGRNFSLTIRFGEPLRAASTASRDGHSAACDHLFREFLAVIAEAPEECSLELLTSLRSVAPPSEPMEKGCNPLQNHRGAEVPGSITGQDA